MGNRLTHWLDRLDYRWLVPLALVLFCLPWPMGPEPHLFEKLRMLADGELTRFIDIFDVVWHGGPALLLAAKGLNDLLGTSGEDDES